MNINIFILEDNKKYRDKIQKIVQHYTSSILSFSFPHPHNYLDFLEYVSSKEISDNDLFFLDIDLKTNFTGVDIAKKIRQKNKTTPIIFLTSFSNQAVTIINESIHALGYIIKQVGNDELLQEKIFELLQTVEKKYLLMTQKKDSLVLTTRSEYFIFNSSDILYVESLKGSRGQVMVHTHSKSHIVKDKISNIKKLIKADYMLTDLNSFIINLDNIQSLDRLSNTIYFVNSEQLIVGTKVFNKVFTATKEYRNG